MGRPLGTEAATLLFDRLLGRKFMEFNGRPSQLITDCVEISRSVDGL